ncbi:protein of unknown function [Modestobacter sp. DSM 44400]|uniref:DUF4192 domain-containing protein n=1 Tax=Modestobacter sp. DSM 44400 TaxID=1550230 RepID=UPI000894CF4A|nr:DUF4192 domain-containing protein [Modestobacter sp. DSM 44400]SDY85262.1 protein of unknown function [Modestobacter sp. DSM 44400]
MSAQKTRITDTRDLLGAIPTMLGFHPHHSLVMLGITTPSGQLGPVARADFPDDQAEAAALLGKLGQQLHGFGVSHVIAVLFTADVEPQTAPGVRTVFEALWTTTAAAGLGVLEVWHVGPTLYRSLPATAAQEEVSRTGLVEDLYGGRVLAELVGMGVPVSAGTREDLFACLTPAPEVHRASVAVLVERYRLELAAGAPTVDAAFLTWKNEAERARANPDAVHELAPDAAALLLACLPEADFRDAVMVDSVPGGDPVGLALLTGDPSSQALLAELLESVFTSGKTAPDPVTVNGARRVLEALVRQAPAGVAAHPLAVLAFLAWWQDETVIAGEAAQRAVEDEGVSTLATLVAKALGVGFRPGWTAASRQRQ